MKQTIIFVLAFWYSFAHTGGILDNAHTNNVWEGVAFCWMTQLHLSFRGTFVEDYTLIWKNVFSERIFPASGSYVSVSHQAGGNILFRIDEYEPIDHRNRFSDRKLVSSCHRKDRF